MVTNKTRLMSVLAALLMIVSMFAVFVIPASAADAVPSKGLYDATALPDIADGYTGATAYQVKDAAGLYALADWVNEEGVSFSGVTIYQTADIDLGWEFFPGIGYSHGSTAKRSFNGTFDGNGFIIEGLFVSRQGDSIGTSGLFGLIAGGAVIKNVGVASGFVYGRNWVGGVVGRTNGNNCKVINCWNAATIFSHDGMSAGGVVGSLAGSGVQAVNCYNVGLLICNTGKIAGISGWTNDPGAVIKNSYNAGQIVGHFNGDLARERECLYDYSPVVVHDYAKDRGKNFANNYYVKGRGKISSVKDSGLTTVPGTETAIIGKDASTGVEASALTDGSLATALNGAGLTDAPSGYTVAFENVEGVGYPVLTYRKDGAIAAQRTATATDLVNGDETALANSALWAMLKAAADSRNTTAIAGMDITVSSAADLWLAAMISGGMNYTGTVTMTADIDMDDLGIDGLKYYIPFSDGGNFNGTFDGQNHVIKNWAVYAPLFDATPRGELIPHVNGATVKNLGMVDAYVVYERITGSGGYLYPALMVGREPSGDESITTLTMDNCFAEGTVYCKDVANTNNYGGVFSTAWNDDVAITNCWADVDYIDSVYSAGRDAHAMGKLNKAATKCSNVYQVFEGESYKGTDNFTEEASANLTGSCKDAALATALNEKMGGEKWKFNGEYTTFASSTAVGDPMNNVEAALELLGYLDTALFVEKDAIDAAAAKLAAATADTAAAALAEYNALTFTLKDGAYPPFAKRAAYLLVVDSITDWGIGTYEDWADFADVSVAAYYEGKTFHLTNDIDMKNRHVDGVGAKHFYITTKDNVGSVTNYGYEFRGTLNGHGYGLKNYANYINLAVVVEGGTFGRMYKATVTDFSVEGKIKTFNTPATYKNSSGKDASIEPLIGGLAGICSGLVNMKKVAMDVDVDATSCSSINGITISGIARLVNASNIVDNCYSIGDIKGNTSINSYAGSLSGYSQGSGEYYNSFGAGALSGKVLGAVRYNGGSKDQYFNNTYSVGYSFDGQQTHSTEAQYELNADAYSTGELAYKLNNGYVEGKGTKGYYTLVDNKTVFGTEANQTRSLTINKKMDGALVETVSAYINAGTVYELDVPAGYEVDASNLNQYDAAAGTFVMPTTDVVVEMNFSGDVNVLMQQIVDTYAPYKNGYEKDFDYFVDEEKMRTSYEAAKSVLDNTAVDKAAAVATATENFVAEANLVLKKVYPYYPAIKDYDTYKALNTANAAGRHNWAIASVEDWEYLINDNFDPKAAKYLGSDAATKLNNKDGDYAFILNVTRDIDFNNKEMKPLYGGTNYTIEGNSHVFKNINVVVNVSAPEGGVYVGLLGGQPWNVLMQNLGVDGGTVKVTGNNSTNKDIFVSTFQGWNGGYTAYLLNCWSTADVVLDVTGGGTKIASGLINMRRPLVLTNCYFGGTVTSTGSSAVIWCTDGSNDELYKNVWSTAQGVQLSNIANGASSSAGIVSADAVESGEMAYLLNNNYVQNALSQYLDSGRPYFDVVDGKTLRVDADPNLRKITMKLGGQADKCLYAKDGETVTLNYVNGATYEIASGNGTIAGDQLTVNGDVVVNVNAEGILILDELKAAVNAYADKDASLYTNENSDSLVEVLETVAGIIDGSVPAVQAQVDAYVGLLNSFYLINKYPNLPKASDMNKYPVAVGYLVYDLADLNAVANATATLTVDQTIYLMDDVTVTAGASANSMKGLKASIDGNGYTIKGVHVVGDEDDWGGSAWLGNYSGKSVKNLVLDSWTTESLGWQGALLVSEAASNATYENITIKDSVVTGGTVRNGLAALIGIVRSTTVNIKNIRVENTKLLRNSVNFGFVLGRNENGTVTMDGIYLVDNTIGHVTEAAIATASGRGIVAGETTGATSMKNVAVFNTTFENGVTALGILSGCLKVGDDGASAGSTAAAMTVTNVVAVDNANTPLINREVADGKCTLSNVYTDSEKLVGKKDEVVNTNIVTPDQYPAAAFTMNLVSDTVKWEAPADGYPEFDTDGKGLPMIIYFKANDNDPATTDYTGSLFTNAEGKLVGITNELLEAAYWTDADTWADRVFTESTTITGTPIPAHECVWGNHSHIDGTNTHYAECTWSNGTVECPKTGTMDCDFTYDVETVDPEALPEDAAHAATCACGNGTGEVLCSEDADHWTVTDIPGDCDTGDATVYSCAICGYTHTDEDEAEGHKFTGAWVADDVAEGEAKTHSRPCDAGCGELETKNCTFTGEWDIVENPGVTTEGKKVKYCDEECGSFIEEAIPALGGITIDPSIGIAGKDMTVDIVLNSNNGLAGAEYYVTYDPTVMTLIDAVAGDWALDLISFGPASEPDDNGYVTSIVNFATFASIEEDGVILTLTFEVAEDAESGDYFFGVESLASTFEGVEYEPIGFVGTVKISDSLRGDINMDNVVTIADAVLMLRVANGDVNIPVELDLSAADVITETNTPELTVNTDDVVRVLQYLNGTIEAV